MTEDIPRSDLETLLEHTGDIITVVDEEGRIQYGNQSIDRVLGYDPEMLVGRQISDWVHPDDRQDLAAVVTESNGAETSESVEFRFRRADGSWVWLDAVRSADPGSDSCGYILNLRDVTDRHQAEEEQRAIFDRMTDAFYALDSEWRFTYLNDRATELLDSTREDLVGKPVWELFPEAVETVLYDEFHEAIETQTPADFDLYYEPLETHFSVRVYPAESGLTVYFRDVTDDRRLRQELEASVDALHALYELASATELSFETKRERVIRLGAEYLDLPYGFVTEIDDGTQLIVDSVGDHDLLQPGEVCPLEDAYCRRTVEADGLVGISDASAEGWEGDSAYDIFQLESYVGGKLLVDDELYGTLCFAGTESRPSFTDSERAFVELASRWLSYELDRKEYRERIEERNKRLEEFASIVSHDLRNPLNVAQLRLDEARRDQDSDALAAVDAAHDRMAELIEDLLALARNDRPVEAPSPVDFGAFVDECWSTVETSNATLVNEAERRPLADEGRLRQLLENLFRNAVEHGGQDVTITVGTVPDGFYVTDDGPGIPADDRDTVFEEGFSTAEEGTGFGLTIVKRIADAHEWDVSLVESESGGACFEFTGVTFAD